MTVSQQQKQNVRRRAKYHCEYCKRSEEIVATTFEIDHILPISKGGSDEDNNLCCACRDCNAHKSNRENCTDPETNEEVSIFNPRTQNWSENFYWSDDGSSIIGMTSVGRATVNCLNLNSERICKARLGWRKLGWTPSS